MFNLNNFEHYYKAYMPLIVAGILIVLGWAGITGDMTVKDAVGYIAASVLVYLVKNKPKKV